MLINKKEYSLEDSLEGSCFVNYFLQMDHLASDFLKKDLTAEQITRAVMRAIAVAKVSGLNVSRHFKPIYSRVHKNIISDCELSCLAYGLVLMNADSHISIVGDFQRSLLETYLANRNF